MFKSALKLSLKMAFTVVVLTVACTLLSSGGKVAADSTQCPNVGSNGTPHPEISAVYTNSPYGFNQGEQDDGFAGVTVSARVGSYADDPSSGPSSIGSPLNISYTLHSQLPPLQNNADHYYNPSGQPNDRRIFQLNPHDPIHDTDSRTDSHDFSTGTNIYTNVSSASSKSDIENGPHIVCNGWSIIGPGTSSPNEWGNRWGLDCGEQELDSNNNPVGNPAPTHFWINNIDPSGVGSSPGNGYWEIQTNGHNFTDGGSNNMNYNNSFVVTNGVTQQVFLIWHPDKPHHTPGTNPFCTGLTVANEDTYSGGHTYTQVTISGTDNDVSYNNPNNAHDNGFIGYQDKSHTYAYHPRGPTVTISVQRYYNSTPNAKNPTWTAYSDPSQAAATAAGHPYEDYVSYTQTFNCYSTSCSVYSVTGDVPGGPSDAVIQGTGFDVVMQVTNNGPLTLNSPTLSGTSVLLDGDNYLDNDDTGYARFHFTAPSGGPTTYPINFALSGNNDAGGSLSGLATCSITVPVFQHFNINPTATIVSGTSQENPYEADGVTRGVSYTVGGTLTEGQTTAATTTGELTKNGGPADGPHSTPDSYTLNVPISHQYDHPDSGFAPGDQYCPTVTIYPGNGYHGPVNPATGTQYPDADDQNAVGGQGCLTVTDEPFFKVLGSGVSARDGITDPSGACLANATNSGLLAGWNDNFDGPGADRGSGSELSALAMIKITGVASAQTAITRSPTDLTFANTNSADISSERDSPSLGGNFGGTPTCATPPTAQSGAVDLAANPANLPASGNYSHTGNLELNGGTISGPTAVYVNGDVYINNSITYNQAGWAPGSVPSLVLVATGNIYIDPSVTQLDGIYISQPKDATHGGTIYTCATALSTTSFKVNNDFSGCKNQLVVTGSFSASKVKLLRTFGSLRDEVPSAGSPAGSQLGLIWDTAGPPSGPLPAGNCTHITEPADPNTWNDNYLCLPPPAAPTVPVRLRIVRPTLQMAWTYAGGTGYTTGDCVAGGNCTEAYLQSNGYPYCTSWDGGQPAAYTWSDNYLCMNKKVPGSTNTPLVQFSTTDKSTSDPTQYCTNIQENGPDGQWNYSAPGSGYWLCEPKAAPAGTPTAAGPPFTNCSNGTSAGAIQTSTQSCAAEIFQFSPELYLTVPETKGNSNGAIQYDAITNLPPVL